MSLESVKILFVAFGCEPGRGSEPGVGWGFVDEASRRRPTWVITHSHHREALDRYLANEHSHHPIHATYVKLSGLGWLWKTHFGINVYYYLWQLKAAFVGRRLARKVGLDLVQHVSFTRYWMHSAGARIGVPFVFGPVGGGDQWPVEFWEELSWRERLRERYWAFVRWLMEHDPLLRRTLRKAKAVIASGQYSRQQLRRLGVREVDVMSAVAPTPKLPPPGKGPLPDEMFHFVSIGRVPRWKGVHLGLQSFAEAFGPTSTQPDAKVSYSIIGDGADLGRLKQLAQNLGIADRVRFLGDLPYAQCLEHLVNAGAMIHPALRDSAGLVFESLSLGVPVACVAIGTPALLIGDLDGAVIPIEGGARAVVSKLAALMRLWRNDHAAYQAARRSAAERSTIMSRRARGDALDLIYARVLADGTPASVHSETVSPATSEGPATSDNDDAASSAPGNRVSKPSRNATPVTRDVLRSQGVTSPSNTPGGCAS